MKKESEPKTPALVGYIFLGTFALFFVGFFLLIAGWGKFTPLDSSIIPAAGKFLIFPSIILSWLLVRAGIKSCKGASEVPRKTKFGLFVFSVNGIAMCLFGGFILVNGLFDDSGAASSSARIVDKKIIRTHSGSRNLSTRKYFLYFTHMSGEKVKDNRVEVDKDFYDRTRSGGILVFKIHQGFLGFQWGNDIAYLDPDE